MEEISFADYQDVIGGSGAASLLGGISPFLRVSHVGQVVGAFVQCGQMLPALLIKLAELEGFRACGCPGESLMTFLWVRETSALPGSRVAACSVIIFGIRVDNLGLFRLGPRGRWLVGLAVRWFIGEATTLDVAASTVCALVRQTRDRALCRSDCGPGEGFDLPLSGGRIGYPGTVEIKGALSHALVAVP